MTIETTLHDGIAYWRISPPTDEGRQTVLLLHGLGNSLNFWVAVAPILGLRHDTIAVDIPGFGRSRQPEGGFSLDRVSAELVQLYRDLGISRAILVAHSLGAFVAMDLAAQMPDIVERVVLVDGTLGTAASITRNPLVGFRHPLVAFSVLSQFAGGLLPIGNRVARFIGHSRIMRTLALWPYVAHPGRLNPEVVTSALANNGGLTVVKVLLEARRIKYVDLMRRVEQPVDIVWGQRDLLIRTEDVAQARVLVDIKRELQIPECGHWPMVEEPQALADFILSLE